MKKRIYLNKKRLEFSKRNNNANNSLVFFREEVEKYLTEKGEDPNSVNVSFDLYEDLLTVSKIDVPKAKYIDTLFGIKIYIDLALKQNQVKFRND